MSRELLTEDEDAANWARYAADAPKSSITITPAAGPGSSLRVSGRLWVDGGEPIPFTDMWMEWAPTDVADRPLPAINRMGPVSLSMPLQRSVVRQVAKAFGIPPYLLGGEPRARLRRMHTAYGRRARARRAGR